MTIDLEMHGGTCDANVYGESGRPGVLVLMDVFGPRPRLTEMAQTVADRGYRVLVPNLFWRRARPPFADPLALMRAHAFAEYVGDAATYLDFFGPAPVRLLGYCLGGNVAVRVAAAYPARVCAVSSAHAGQLVTEMPDSPHRLAPRITAELYVAHADQDQSMTPDQQIEFARALDEAGVTYRAELYVGARHGFTMADRPVFDADACARHWRETFALFERASGEAPE